MILFELSLYLVILLLIFVKTKRQASVLFWFACLVCIFFLSISISNIFGNLEGAGTDFYAYYHASHYFDVGINPFLETGFLQYRYFPITLYFFNVFTIWDYSHSFQIFMLLKIFIYLFTISIWAIYVFKDYELKTFLILIATFGFKQAALIDFNYGNITIFEFFALTIAFIFLLRNKVILYCVVILFLALFKMQIMALIFIPLIKFEKKNVYIILSFLLGCTILFLYYFYFEPALTQAYLNQIFNALGEKGMYSPNFGTLQLINTFVYPLFKPIIDFEYLNYLIYFCWLILVAVLTFLIFKKTKTKVTNVILITYLILVYAITVPRFQDYTFTLLIVPSVFVIQYCISNNILKSGICLLICTSFLGYYQPVIVVFCLFAMYLLYFYRISKGKIPLKDQPLEFDKSERWIAEVSNKEQIKRQRLILMSVSSSLILILCGIYFSLPKTDIFAYSTLLSKNEIKVSKYLTSLQRDFITNAGEDFPPSNYFYENRKIIDTSIVYKIFRIMPKGGNLRLHTFAGNNAEWIVKNLTYMDNCYMYILNDSAETYASMMFFKEDSVPQGWRSLKDLRERSILTDDSLINMITINERDKDNKEIFNRFENIISRLGLINYEPAFRMFIHSLFDSLIADGQQYVELRADLTAVYDLTGKKYIPEETVLIYKEIIDEVKSKHPEFDAKIIYSAYRDSSNETDKDELYKAYELRKKYPDVIIGFDYAIDNGETNNNSFYPEQFNKLDSITGKEIKGLPYFFDFSKSDPHNFDNINSALMLNPKRIANVFDLSSFPELELEVKEKQIAIEVCPLSNQILGYFPDLTMHPAPGYIIGNIPITINSDYPQIFNYNGLTYDFWTAFMTWELDLSTIKKLALNSIVYSSMNEDEKKIALRYFNKKWDEFIDEIANTIKE